MYKAYFTKNLEHKFDYINKLINTTDCSNVVYFCPKKYKELAENNIKNAYIFFYENINKSNDPYDVTGPDTLLILDGSARYKNIMGYVFKRLEKLALITNNKVIVDIVPFTTDIQYSYVPYSHLKKTNIWTSTFFSISRK